MADKSNSFTIDKLEESPPQLLRDHMIVRMFMLGSGQLGYRRRNRRSRCLFQNCYNQLLIMTIATLYEGMKNRDLWTSGPYGSKIIIEYAVR